MPKLSFKSADKCQIPIAIVKGGKHNGDILYLDPRDMGQLKGDEKCIGESKVILDDGVFEPLPTCDPDKRDVFYIAGQSGSGKSYIAKTLANYYNKLYPEREVYLCSSLDKDETLDALKFIKRIKPKSFIDEFPDLDEFQNCCMIFDDIEGLDKPDLAVIQKVIDLIASQGRHTNTTMLYLRHTLTDYKNTRLMLGEMTRCVVYPLTTSKKQLDNLVGNYVGADMDKVMKLRKSGTRWIVFGKGFPNWALTQKTCEILNCDSDSESESESDEEKTKKRKSVKIKK
jgi:hypothetical protein